MTNGVGGRSHLFLELSDAQETLTPVWVSLQEECGWYPTLLDLEACSGAPVTTSNSEALAAQHLTSVSSPVKWKLQLDKEEGAGEEWV